MSADFHRRSSIAPSSLFQSVSQEPLGLEQLRNELSTFSAQFDLWLAQRTDRMVEKRNSHHKTVIEKRDMQMHMEKELTATTQHHEHLQNQIQSDKNAQVNFERQLDELSRAREASLQQLRECTANLDQLQAQLDHLKAEKFAREQLVRENLERNEPELKCYRERLGFSISSRQGILSHSTNLIRAADQMTFVFSHIDPEDWNRKFTFTVDVSERDYRIVECQPPIRDFALLLNRLNETRDFFSYVKWMRKAFVEHVQREKQ